MVDWLYFLPEPLLMALAAALLGGVIVVLPRLTSRVGFLAPHDVNTDFVTRMQAPLFTLTSLVLAFTLVQAESNFRQVDSHVTAEASQINQLDRLLTRYDNPAAAAARPLLETYARSIVQDEWPAMLKNRRVERVNRTFMLLSRTIMTIDPEPGRQALIYGEMLKSLEALAASRETRLDNVQIRLPGIYWLVIGFAVAMLLLVSSTVQQTPYRTAIMAAQMSVLGAFISFVFIMDTPFQGESAVTPDAISHVLETIAQREK